MIKRCNGLNSKCFLLTYLVIVSFLLILWVNRIPLVQEDTRSIPKQLQTYLFSPIKSIDEFEVEADGKLALTSSLFVRKWSFVYFSHHNCLPACDSAYRALSHTQAALQAADIQFVLIDLDTSKELAPEDNLLALAEQDYQMKPLSLRADSATVELLAAEFNALYLTTDYADGSYQIEQEHHIFLVDPKGRLYARFMPPYSYELIRDVFIQVRQFYAVSE